MVTRFLSTSVRWLSRSLLALALIVAFAILVNFSTFANGSAGLDFGQEIEINRALIEADPELSAGLCGQSIEAWDAGDYAAFFELRAQELEDPAQGMKLSLIHI